MAYAEKHSHAARTERSITETAPKASLIMLLTGLFLLLIMTAVSANTPSPTELSPILAPLALYLGIAVGGFFCGLRLHGADGYACAAISAAILTALLLAVKLLIPAPDECLTFSVGVILHLLTVLSAILGALLAGRMPKRKRRNKSKYRR